MRRRIYNRDTDPRYAQSTKDLKAKLDEMSKGKPTFRAKGSDCVTLLFVNDVVVSRSALRSMEGRGWIRLVSRSAGGANGKFLEYEIDPYA